MQTQRAQPRGGIGQTNHRQRARLMLAVEGGRFSRVEPTSGGIVGIVEPEANTLKGVGRG